MRRRGTAVWVVTALAVAIATGCALRMQNVAAADKPAAASAPAGKSIQVRGFCMQLSNPAGFQDYMKAIDDIADMGCTWINFSIAARQETISSDRISIVWQNIPSQKEIEKLLQHAKERGVRTMLMPIVLLNKSGPTEWRGKIAPPSWDNWFASYTDYITKMAKLATKCDVDLFCVGSELLSTEAMTDRWDAVIAQVKTEYTGKLTYSSNWDHYDYVTFWDKLDYIGMNNYNELAQSPGASVTQLNEAWEPIKKKYLDFVQKQGKPFFFTEVGWHNLENTLAEPWNYVAEGDIKLNEQLHAYQSFVATWQNVPSDKFMGAFIWEWKPGANGATDHGTYSLQGTPSLDVVKKWMHG